MTTLSDDDKAERRYLVQERIAICVESGATLEEATEIALEEMSKKPLDSAGQSRLE